MDEKSQYQTPLKIYDKPFDLTEMNESNFSTFFGETAVFYFNNFAILNLKKKNYTLKLYSLHSMIID